LGGQDLDSRILEALKGDEQLFKDILKKMPNVRPLIVKLALDELEREGRVRKFIKEGRYFFGLSK